jgi:hypothetical protein
MPHSCKTVFFDEIKKIEGWARELGFYPTPLKYF